MSEYHRYQSRQPRNRLGRAARRRAADELRRRHAEEYARLVNDYRVAWGLPPAKKGRPTAGSS